MAKPRRPSAFVTGVADLQGHRRTIYVLRSGRLVPIAGLDFTASAHVDSTGYPVAKPRQQLVAETWEAVLRTYNEWVSSGRFTLIQLKTIRMLLLEGRSLREVARREGVSGAAISDRINALRDKAPQFYRWWTARHSIRRHAAHNRLHAR